MNKFNHVNKNGTNETLHRMKHLFGISSSLTANGLPMNAPTTPASIANERAHASEFGWAVRSIAATVMMSFLTLTVAPQVNAMQLAAERAESPFRSNAAPSPEIAFEDRLQRFNSMLDQATPNASVLKQSVATNAASTQRLPSIDAILAESNGILADASRVQSQIQTEIETLSNIGASSDALQRGVDTLAKLQERQSQFERAVFALKEGRKRGQLTASADQVAALAASVKRTDKEITTAPHPKQLPFQAVQKRARTPFEDAASLSHVVFSEKLGAITTTSQLKALTYPNPTQDYLAATDDAPQSAGTTKLAQSLGNNPVRIYQYVRDNLEYLPTYGSIQGGSLALINKRGNAFDSASALISLLRAAGIHSRYVYGTIDVPADQIANWLGVEDANVAQDLLSKGGVPAASVIAGGRVAAIRMEHVWVEAYVQFYPSRGANHTGGVTQGDTWVPMDPSFKQNLITPKIDLAAGAPFDGQQVLTDLYNSGKKGTNGSITGMQPAVLEQAFAAYKPRMINYANSVRPNATLGDLMQRKTIKAEGVPYLAGSLPYRTVAQTDAFAAIPKRLQHVISAKLYNSSLDRSLDSPALTYSMPLAKLGVSTFGVHYAPATPGDAAIIEQYRAQNAASIPAYSINVIPRLQIEGVTVASGSTVRMGTDQLWDVVVIDPQGIYAPNSEANKVTAGSEIVFGIDAAGITPEMIQRRIERLPINVLPPARELLQQGALHFWMMHDHTDQVSANAWNGHIVRMPSVGMFAQPLTVSYFLGVPRNGFYNGFVTDVKRIVLATSSPSQNAQVRMLTQAGVSGSMMEAMVWEMLLGAELGTGASAARMLAAANEQNIPIYTVDSTNVATIVPLLQTSPDAKSEITAAIANGYVVTVPERDLVNGRYRGIGYIVQNPATGDGLYRIDGGKNGGALIGCLARAVPLDALFKKILKRILDEIISKILSRIFLAALLAVAGTVFPVVAAVFGTVMWFVAFAQALMEFRQLLQEGNLEELLGLPAGALACTKPGCGGGGGGFGGGGGAGGGGGHGGPTVGNPIFSGNGVKQQTERDYVSGGDFPLDLSRQYMSDARIATAWGRSWRSNYDRSIYIPPPGVVADSSAPNDGFTINVDIDIGTPASISGSSATTTKDSVIMYRADGGYYQFDVRGSGNGSYVTNADIPEYLSRQADGTGKTTGWTYKTQYDETELYSAEGKLLSITNRAGMTQSLSYNGQGQLASVRDHFGRTMSFSYNADGSVATMTDPLGGIYRYTVDSEGRMTGVQFPDGKTKTYHYESDYGSALLTGITDETGNRYSTYRYNYQAKAVETSLAGGAQRVTLDYIGDTTKVTDALGTSRTYNFATIFENKRLTGLSEPCAACGASGGASAMSYDANGYVASSTDFNGNLTTYSRDGRGLEATRVEAAGTANARTITTSWHASLRLPLTITEPAGNAGNGATAGTRTTTYTYDARGNVLTKAVTVSQGGANGTTSETRTWTYTYNSVGQMLSAKGPRTDIDETMTYVYDAASGNLTRMTDAVGNKTTYDSYDAHGRLTQSTDPNGLITALAYDARNRLITQTMGTSSGAGNSETTTYAYDGAGNLKTLTLPDSTSVSYTYDAAQRLTKVADSLGNQISYTLDGLGNRTSETAKDPNNTLAQTQTRSFDILGRLQKAIGATRPSTQITQYAYDEQGNLKSMTDPLAHATGNSYDALNRLITTLDAAGNTTTYKYDTNDQLASLTDPRGIETRYTQNGYGETIQLASNDSGTASTKYDAAGNATRMTDARGVTIEQRFDALNRLLSAAYKTPAATQETISYVYGDSTNPADATVLTQTANAKGRLAKLTDASGSTRYRYDIHGRVTEKTQAVKNQNGNATEILHTQSYRYNAAGQLEQITTASNQTIGYSYTNNQITSITVNGQPLLANALYFPFGGIKQWSWGAANSSNLYQRTFDTDGRIKSVTLGNQTRSYSYDDASRIVTLTDANNASAATNPNLITRATAVDYDNLDRLTSETQKLNPNATTGAGTESYKRGYSYDAVGNRLSKSVSDNAAAAQNTAYAAATNSNRLATVGGTTQQHDNAGNLIADGTYGFIYSARNRLRQVNSGNDATTTQPNANTIARYAHNGFGERVWKQASNAANDERYFVYDEDGHLQGEYDGTGKLIQETVWLDDTPVATIRPNAVVYRIWADHLDTPRTITAASDAANQSVWSWDSDAFGNALQTNGNLNVSTLEYNLRFPGQYFDAETNLHYNYFRDYNASTGRYVQSDPIGLNDDWNLYAYVAARPLTYIDALGLAKGKKPPKPPKEDCTKHGNCKDSKRLACLYRLEYPCGVLFKWGISQDPKTRYTQKYLVEKGVKMVNTGRCHPRKMALLLERVHVENDAGPGNNEPWANCCVKPKP